jgi:diguanylate cyclase
MRSLRARKEERPTSDDLFVRIGAFLSDHGLSPDPAHYAFAFAILSDPEGALGRAVADLTDGGVRLSSRDIEGLGGSVGARTAASSSPVAAMEVDVAEAVDGFAGVMRAMHDETLGFGRDLAAHADAMRRAGPGVPELARITGAMLARIHEAEGRLANATRETEDLRGKLHEARAVARRDPLTGLPNRRAFEEAYADTPRRPLFLALCDVDRFKRINDGFGHGVGDRVLNAIGDTLRVACDGHLVARHGGEEFAVLIEGPSIKVAAAMLENARAGVAAKRFRARETQKLIGQVTISVGLTAVGPDEPLDLACARADRFLYNAKATGRDRICMG